MTSPGQWIQPQIQRTGVSYAEVIGSRFDTQKERETFVGYYVTLPTADYGATVKLQGSMTTDEEVWVDLKPMDETGTQYASADIAIGAGAAKYLLVAPDLADGALSTFRRFRIAAKSTNAAEITSVRVRGFCK